MVRAGWKDKTEIIQIDLFENKKNEFRSDLIDIDCPMALYFRRFGRNIFRICWFGRYATAHLCVQPQQYRPKLARYRIVISTNCVFDLVFRRASYDDANNSKDDIQLMHAYESYPQFAAEWILHEMFFHRLPRQQWHTIQINCEWCIGRRSPLATYM